MATSGDTAHSGDTPIDLDHLRMITFRDEALERELLGLFSARASVALMEIEKADSDRARADAAHRLVGAAKAIGANELAEAALAIETEPKLSRDNVDALSTATASVIAFLETKLATGQAKDAG